MSEWLDITFLCKDATKSMTFTEPMIAIESFSLLESMSAVEIMDPKMDQCCGLDGPFREDELLKNKLANDVLLHLPTSSTVQILHSLFVYEAAFLDGASIMESVNQCLFLSPASWNYLKKTPNLATNSILYFCQSLVKSVDYYFTGVLAADIFEDEDFQAGFRTLIHSYSIEINDEEFLSNINEFIQSLSTTQKSSYPQVDESDEYLSNLLNARLQFQMLQQTLSEWIHPTVAETRRTAYGNSQEKLPPVHDLSKYITQIQKIKTIAEITQSSLQILEESFNKMISQNLKVSSVDELNGKDTIDDVIKDTMIPQDINPSINFAFSRNLTRIAQVSPVRTITFQPFSKSILSLKNIAKEILDLSILALSLLENAELNFDEILYIVMDCSKSNQHLLTRTYLIAILSIFNTNMHNLLYKSMSMRGIPTVFIDSDLVSFTWIQSSLSIAMWDTLKTLCVNRNKLFGRMEGILSYFGTISADSLIIDGELKKIFKEYFEIPLMLKQQWFSSWAMIITTSLMDQYLSLMMEFQLLEVNELDYFFWYWDFVCNSYIFSIDKLKTARFEYDTYLYENPLFIVTPIMSSSAFVTDSETHGDDGDDEKDLTPEDNNKNNETDNNNQLNNTKNNNSKKKKKKKKSTSKASQSQVIQPIIPTRLPPKKWVQSADEGLMRSKSVILKGIFRLLVVIERLKLENKPEFNFTNYDGRFRQRFHAFEAIVNPPPLNHEEFLKTIAVRSENNNNNSLTLSNDAMIEIKAILGITAQCFQNARLYVDELKKLIPTNAIEHIAVKFAKNTTKAIVGCSISTTKLTQLLSSHSIISIRKSLKLNLNFSYHSQFPVVEAFLDDTNH
eukprot:gene16017-21740_t